MAEIVIACIYGSHVKELAAAGYIVMAEIVMARIYGSHVEELAAAGGDDVRAARQVVGGVDWQVLEEHALHLMTNM